MILLLALGIGIQAGGPWLEATLGLSPVVVTTLVGVIFLAAKSFAPGTGSLNQAIAIIEGLLSAQRQPQEGVRSALPESVAIEPVPDRPNTLAKIMWG